MTLEELLTTPVATSFMFLNGTDFRQAKYAIAVDLMRDTFNSREFREAFLKATYKGKPGFASTDMSPEKALEKIIKGAEELDPIEDYTWEWKVNFYYKKNNVVGYTSPDTKTISVNTYFFDTYSPEDVARNIFHELTHKLGFDHDFEVTARRPDSLPYEGGDLMQTYARARLNGVKPPVKVVTKTMTKFSTRVWWKPWTWF